MEERRKCYRCGELKPPEEFSWRRKYKGQRDSFCKPCRSAYGKEHYAANRQRYIDQAGAVKRRVTDAVVLEFDHLRDKAFAIGPQLSRKSWKHILEEMKKCEVVCANCHRRRTARRRGALRAVLTQATGD